MSVAASHRDNTRRCANFTANKHLEQYEVDDNVEHKVQKEKLKKVISSNNQNPSGKLDFIDWVQPLGVSYHFEHKIEDTLSKIHSIYTSNNNVVRRDGGDNLHFVALLFRLLRQHGYPVSSYVFERFKDIKGKLNNESLAEDNIEGMLALYEATQLEVPEESILDEALHFTYTCLKSLIDNNQLSPCLNARVNHRLSQPLHKRLHRLEHLHKREIGNITKWWKEPELPKEVPYARDRLAESYFWSLAMSYEPQLSTTRMITSKLVAIICLLDGIYTPMAHLKNLNFSHRPSTGLITDYRANLFTNPIAEK
ncbi:alpha-copaene synthase-like [Neltuma alba]|uniref:alpha-copaene synthase-like n=1 Tax=Neltuma alba TaxID=207710 RepID=UPI0010A49591|nr:alpha-copaene synthase-like [Prosopis alba]